MIHAATAGSPRLQCRRMTLLAVKSDQQIDAKAPDRGDERVGAPMAMTQQRAAQRSSTSGEAVTVSGLSHGRPVCFARGAQRNNNGRVARPLSAYLHADGRAPRWRRRRRRAVGARAQSGQQILAARTATPLVGKASPRAEACSQGQFASLLTGKTRGVTGGGRTLSGDDTISGQRTREQGGPLWSGRPLRGLGLLALVYWVHGCGMLWFASTVWVGLGDVQASRAGAARRAPLRRRCVSNRGLHGI
jgi:hypothetical protein